MLWRLDDARATKKWRPLASQGWISLKAVSRKREPCTVKSRTSMLLMLTPCLSSKAVFVEPLRDNPAAKTLRALTPRARTAAEKPLTRAEIKRGDSLFGSSEHFFFNLVSVPIAMATSLAPLSADCTVPRLADYIDWMLARTLGVLDAAGRSGVAPP